MRSWLMIFVVLLSAHAFGSERVRLKDIGRFEGVRENYLIGYGVVTGLAGTGDSSHSKATRQSIANLLSSFDVSITSDQINSRNVAIVSVMASLPPVSRRGDKVDVVVTSLGDAKSLVGGTLLLTSMKGADGKVHALAQGPVSVGGYRYDQNGNLSQKNHPTVGAIPGGAQIERELASTMTRADGSFGFVLDHPDYTTARRVVDAINGFFKETIAKVEDSGAAVIRKPSGYDHDLSELLSLVEGIQITPDTRATVVVNERTGTIVVGGDVQISKVTIALGDIKVSVVTDYTVSQPVLVNHPGFNVRTEVVPNTSIDVNETPGNVVEMKQSNTVADLMRALNGIKASTRDVIAVLQGIKAAGALQGELVIQ